MVFRETDLIDEEPTEIIDSPLSESGWEFKLESQVKGIFPSQMMYRWSQKKEISGETLVREAGSLSWSPLKKNRERLEVRSMSKAFWTLFQSEPALRWWYVDNETHMQGPFRGETMWGWLAGGYLYRDLLVFCTPADSHGKQAPNESDFVPLKILGHMQIMEETEATSTPQSRALRGDKLVPGYQAKSAKEASASSGGATEVIEESLRYYAPFAYKLFTEDPARSRWYIWNANGICGPETGKDMYRYFLNGWLCEDLKLLGYKEVVDESLAPNIEGMKGEFRCLIELLDEIRSRYSVQ